MNNADDNQNPVTFPNHSVGLIYFKVADNHVLIVKILDVRLLFGILTLILLSIILSEICRGMRSITGSNRRKISPVTIIETFIRLAESIWPRSWVYFITLLPTPNRNHYL
jgi:hypothetical protein